MKVNKAVEITDAIIPFVSLVDKAANQRQFLITKAQDGNAEFKTYGRILKVDNETHYITGVVYEPMKEDAHGNFMTEEEIRKSAYWFAKNGDKIDLQHNFQPVDGVSVVESYVTLCDMQIGDELVAKGSWILTTEVRNDAIWKAVENEDITGYSMGGVGKYSQEEVELDTVTKQVPESDETKEKMGVLQKFAAWLGVGVDLVEKGAMKDNFESKVKASSFWSAFSTLEDLLYPYNYYTGSWEFESSEDTIREALQEFTTIITDILAQKSIAKALAESHPLHEAKSELLKSHTDTYQALRDIQKSAATATKEEPDMDATEVTKIVDERITAALDPLMKALGDLKPQPVQEESTPEPAAAPDIGAIVAEAVAKAMKPAEEPEPVPLTMDAVQAAVEDAVAKAVDPLLKSRGLPSQLDGSENVQKAEPHYLAGIVT